MLIDHGDDATMKLKASAIAAIRAGFIEAVHNNGGWAIRYRDKNSRWLSRAIRCSSGHTTGTNRIVMELLLLCQTQEDMYG